MNVYVDSSVTLRVVLRQADALASWDSIDRAFSSELTRVECLRTVDRARIRFALTDDTVAAQRAALLAILAGMDVVSLDRVVLERAAEPLPTLLGTLDAIHLATATLVRNAIPDLAFATHDSELGLAARAVGFSVDGVPA